MGTISNQHHMRLCVAECRGLQLVKAREAKSHPMYKSDWRTCNMRACSTLGTGSGLEGSERNAVEQKLALDGLVIQITKWACCQDYRWQWHSFLCCSSTAAIITLSSTLVPVHQSGASLRQGVRLPVHHLLLLQLDTYVGIPAVDLLFWNVLLTVQAIVPASKKAQLVVTVPQGSIRVYLLTNVRGMQNVFQGGGQLLAGSVDSKVVHGRHDVHSWGLLARPNSQMRRELGWFDCLWKLRSLNFCIGLGLMCGSFGFIGASQFVLLIYSNIKAE
eukprot:4898124-Amphidinium_carterae.1